MKYLYIDESNMRFGPFGDDNLFYIEKSNSYRAIKDGVQIAEFLKIQSRKKILIIEAKSSAPQPGNQVDFDYCVSEIHNKLINAFSLTLALILKRHPNTYNEIPVSIKTIDISQVTFRFLLVIHGHKEEWLNPLQESLSSSFFSFLKTWAFPPTSVIVVNDEIARQKHLIT